MTPMTTRSTNTAPPYPQDALGRIRRLARSMPLIGPAAVALRSLGGRIAFPGSTAYWERRYARGGDSGPGSSGVLAAFKAEVINNFVATNAITSVIEFGCGDGRQLGLASYPSYIGLDVSSSALERCREKFAEDVTKSFYLYDPAAFVDNHQLFRAELGLSLDVLFHLVEDDVFERYMRHLFGAAERFVIVYSKDTDEPATVGYVRNRRFTPWVAEHLPEWQLAARIENRYPWTGDVRSSSECDFYIYERRE